MQSKYGEGENLPDFTACWSGSTHQKQGLAAASLAGSLAPFSASESEDTPPGLMTQFIVISRRNLITYMRNKIGFRARMGQTLFFGLLLGCVFYNLTPDATGIQDRQGLLFFVNINMFFTGSVWQAVRIPRPLLGSLTRPPLGSFLLCSAHSWPTRIAAGLLGVVLIFPEERRLFEREFASGYYGEPGPSVSQVRRRVAVDSCRPAAKNTIKNVTNPPPCS
jgi:hypothetical protein